MRYVQDGVANSNIFDEYGLINYAQTKLNDESINSVEQAIEKLESETSTHEHWVSAESSDKIREQVRELLGANFDIALGKFIADQAEGMKPNAYGLGDFTYSKRVSFIERNVDDALEFYEMTQAHSLDYAVNTWINQNYVDAVSKVISWADIVDAYVDKAIESIHAELPDMDLGTLRSYLIAHINEVQSEYPHFNHIVDTLKENNPQVLDENSIREQVRLAFEDNMRYMGWDEEHFERGTGESVTTFIDEVTYCILAGYDEITENQVEEEIDYQMGEFEDDINHGYVDDIDTNFTKYAQEHGWDDYSLTPAEDVDAIHSDSLAEWADNIETFIQDNYPELLESDGDSNREELIEKVHQEFGNFRIAAVYNPDTSSFDSFLEDVNVFNNVSDAIDEFLAPDVDEWIEEEEGFFEEYLPDNNEEYAGLSLQEARAKYLQEEPNCATYLNYLKAIMDLESVVESVGFNDIFYNADEIVDYYLSFK